MRPLKVIIPVLFIGWFILAFLTIDVRTDEKVAIRHAEMSWDRARSAMALRSVQDAHKMLKYQNDILEGLGVEK